MSATLQAAFVPLAVGSPPRPTQSNFQVLVAPNPEKARPLRQADPVSSPPAQPHAAVSACQPRVTLERDGDRVTAIHIECSCGQEIDLSCVYSPPSATT